MSPTGTSVPGGRPAEEPIGLVVARAGRVVDRAFDDALAAAGGTRPMWLILLAILTGSGSSQAALADRVGITGPTLVHHLDRLEAAGLVARQSDPSNRRIRSLALTPAGREAFHTLRAAAADFDARLRSGLSQTDLERLRHTIRVLQDNSATPPHPEEEP